MSNAWIALGTFVTFLALALGWRTWRQLRLTGKTGFHGISGRPGTAQWWGGVLFVVALMLGLAAPLAGLLEWLPPLIAPREAFTIAGCGIAGVALVATLWAQHAMGASWRIGVDPTEKTALVTRGPFNVVRNPIFSFMMLHALGVALLVPNAIACAAFVALLLAVELQVRFVEEPHLVRTQGDAYRAYARRVGRFVPGAGHLSMKER